MFSVSSVSKSYGKNKVLTDVSLSVSPGECIALLGINGSGKSTLLGILSRNIKPDSGCFGFDCQANAALLPQDNPLRNSQPLTTSDCGTPEAGKQS